MTVARFFLLISALYPALLLADAELPTMLPLKFAKSRTEITIRVKVFPHLLDYAPQGKDADSTQVSLKSSSPDLCKIYEGMADEVGSTGKLLGSTHGLNLKVADLKTPLWIECPSSVQLTRVGDTKSYSYLGPLYVHKIRVSTTPQPISQPEFSADYLEIIHPLPLESYLKGVVPVEVPATWPEETLKAQAVAARTYALFHLEFSHEPTDGIFEYVFYDVDDTVFYQAFTGVTNQTRATDQAVDDTQNQVMTYDGKIIQAYFSADSGGYTEDAAHAWPVLAPYCKAKPEIFKGSAAYIKKTSWSLQMSLSEINRRLKADKLVPNANPVVGLNIPKGSRYASGRASIVRLSLRDGATFDLQAPNFRRSLNLKSTLFSFQKVGPGLLEFNGRGYGHGVGMQQDGAEILAKDYSWNYGKILNFYYDGIQIGDYKKVSESF